MSLVTTRAGNGALDALAERGGCSPRGLEAIEDALAFGLSLERGRVLADLWDLERLRRCARCFGRARTGCGDEPDSSRAGSGTAAARTHSTHERGSFDVAVLGTGCGGSSSRSPARASALRRPRRARDASAARHRRTLLAPSPPAPRGALRPYGGARLGRSRRGLMAAAISRDRMRLEARLHVLRPVGAFRAAIPKERDQLLGRGEPARRNRPDALVSRGLRAFLAGEARAEGTEYFDSTRLDSIRAVAGGFELEGERLGRRMALRARFIADVSGPEGVYIGPSICRRDVAASGDAGHPTRISPECAAWRRSRSSGKPGRVLPYPPD